MARARNPNPTPYRLTLGQRGAMRLPPQDAGMTYHHILPFNELRDFWNAAVANDQEQLGETLVPALLESMRLYPLDQANPVRASQLIETASELLQQIRAGNYVHSPSAASPVGIDDFNAVYTWMPGNLFPGPTKRASDPGDQFDNFASRFVEGSRYLTVLRAHQAIRLYLDQFPPGGYSADAQGTRARGRAAQTAHAAGLALAQVAKYVTMIAYDPARWPAGLW
jgi:hypothetical protein